MRFCLTILLLAFAFTASAQAEPGITDTRIKVGMITDLTGPIAFAGQEISAGARLYFKHINAQGGVHGRKIDLIVEDDGYQPPRTIAAFRKLLSRDGVFCFLGNLGSSTTMATLPLIKRERVPLITPGNFNSAMFTPPRRYVFALDPSNPTQAWIIVKYIRENAPAAKLALIYQDDDYGRDGLKGFRKAAKHYNLPIVAEASHKRGAVDFSTQVLSVKQKNPTHVVLFTIVRETASILEKAHQLNWHPAFIGSTPASDNKVIELAGEAAKGYMALSYFDLESDTPDKQTKRYLDLIQQYHPERKAAPFHAWGVSIAQILVEGLQRAGKDLTREKLVEAMESFNNWQEYMGAPVTYGPNLRGGGNTAAFFVKADVERKAFVRVTDWVQYEKRDEIAGNQE